MNSSWRFARTIDTSCTVDLEQTVESLHAYVDLDGVEVGPGDQVIVHDAPTVVDFGGKLICRRRATVMRASSLGKLLARLGGYLELTELYEVSFSDGRAR
jgi:hypothetical protein